MKTNVKINFAGKLLLLKLLCLCFLISSCTKEDEELKVIEIGEILDGGIVTHIFKPGDSGYVEGETHGIVVSPTDLSIESQWGCRGTMIGGTSPAIGRGRGNTERVLEFHDNLPDYYNNPTQCHELNDGSVAASVVRELNVDGQTGWFMPSRDEMSILYQNREALGGFEEAEYWSSCESNENNACVVSFATGETLSANKNELRKVRAIRYF